MDSSDIYEESSVSQSKSEMEGIEVSEDYTEQTLQI